MNIQNLPWLKFAHESYLVSEFKAKASAIAKAAYFDLLCFAMKQSPALSLPNCDDALAGWASLTLEAWQQIKDIVLSQFSLNPNDNRYYSPMLIELYSEASSENNSPAQQKSQRSSSAERVARHRAKQKQSNADVTPHVTHQNVTCNADVTPVTVTLGGKGGDLDLKLENLEKEVVVNTVFLNNESTLDVTPCNAVTPKRVTQHTTTKFCIPFDFNVEPSELQPFIDKLEVPMAKHTSQTLNHFVAHYLAKDFKNTRDEWIFQYAMWLKREKDKPVVNPTTPMPNGEQPPKPKEPAPPVRLADDRPAWMVYAERNAAKQAAQAVRQAQVRH